MGEHASDCSPEDSGGGSVVDECSARVGEQSLSEELREFDFVSEEGSCDVNAFTSDDCYSLA